MSIRLMIADDDLLISESLKIIFGMDDDFEIVACVENGLEAVKICINEKVDVALLDVRMPIMNGIEATKLITQKTNTKILILTTFDEDEYICDAISNGAKGYLLKNNSSDKIKNAIRTLQDGNFVVQDVVLEKIKTGLNTIVDNGIDKSNFTKRELDIMQCIADGFSNKEISRKLFISEGTVKNYITSILNKTGLKHRTQIAIYFLKGGRL